MKPLNKDLLKAAQAAMPAAPPLNANNNGHHTPPPDADAIAAEAAASIAEWKPEPNPFPMDALPKPVASIARRWAVEYNLPVDYYPAGQFICASAAIGNNYQIQYTYDYLEPLMIWFIVVGGPGIGKSPALKKGLKPLLELQRQRSRKLKIDLAERDALKTEGKPTFPIKFEQIVVENTTFEALCKIIDANPHGVLGFHDEFVAFLKGMNSYKNQGGTDLEQFLKIFNRGDLIINRSYLDFPMHMDFPFITLGGGMQPGILHELVDHNKMNVGLFQRLGIFYPVNQLIPIPTEAIPDQKADDEWREIIDRLRNLPTSDDGKPIILNLSEKAYKTIRAHKTHVEQDLINPNRDDENLCAIYIKQISYTFRLAGILELMDLCANNNEDYLKTLSLADMQKLQIQEASIHRAIKISDYLTFNSLKVMARTESPVAALNTRNKALYEALPVIVSRKIATTAAMKLGISEATARRLIYDKNLFAQTPGGDYRKLYT
jgi:hypothetical protein